MDSVFSSPVAVDGATVLAVCDAVPASVAQIRHAVNICPSRPLDP